MNKPWDLRPHREVIKNRCKPSAVPIPKIPHRRYVDGDGFTVDDQRRKRPKNGWSRRFPHFTKWYWANAQTADLDALIKGIRIREKVYKVKSAAYIQGGSKKEIGIEASNLSPGLLKKILEQRSLKALSMDRVLLAGLTKKDLPRGRWRYLTDKEIQFLNMIS